MDNQPIDKPTVINWALTDLGSFATFSIDDDSDLAGQIDRTWQRCVDHCMGLHDWTFLRQTFKLTRHAERPQTGWTYAFELPGGRIGDSLKILAQAGHSPRPLREFDIEGDTLFAHVPDVWARCKVYRDPEHWDPAFRAAFTVALAAFLAVPVTQDTDTRDRKMAEAFGTPSREGTGGMFGRLIAQNRAAQPIASPLLDEDPLTSAHGSHGAYPWHGRY